MLGAGKRSQELPQHNGQYDIVKMSLAFAAYIATSRSGICIDFYRLSAVSINRLEILKTGHMDGEVPQLEPIIRIETLPGRLNYLLDIEGGAGHGDNSANELQAG